MEDYSVFQTYRGLLVLNNFLIEFENIYVDGDEIWKGRLIHHLNTNSIIKDMRFSHGQGVHSKQHPYLTNHFRDTRFIPVAQGKIMHFYP